MNYAKCVNDGLIQDLNLIRNAGTAMNWFDLGIYPSAERELSVHEGIKFWNEPLLCMWNDILAVAILLMCGNRDILFAEKELLFWSEGIKFADKQLKFCHESMKFEYLPLLWIVVD